MKSISSKCVNLISHRHPRHHRHPSNVTNKDINIQKFSFSSTNRWHLTFPQIVESKDGVVEKWLKKEGDEFKSQEALCEVSLSPSDLMVGVHAERSGFVAKILAPSMKKLPIEEPIAILVDSKKELLAYMDEIRVESHDEEIYKVTKKALEEKSLLQEKVTKKNVPDIKTLLRYIKNLINEGKIEDGSEFAKKLLACARKGNAELLSVFAASFDSDYSDDLTMEGGIANKGFDKTFFLENAIDIVNSQNDS